MTPRARAREPIWILRRRAKFPKLTRNLRVDVLVIGGGITGITSAYLLKKAGLKVALIERQIIGSGDTGSTTAHLTYVTDLRLTKLVKRFGRDHAQAVWDAGRAAIHFIHDSMHSEGIECGFRWVPASLTAPLGKARGDDHAELRNEAVLARDLGFDATFRERCPVFERHGVTFANQALFHPLRYISGLADRIPGKGSHIFERSEAMEFAKDGQSVKVNGCTVSFGAAVIATHIPLMGSAGVLPAALFQTKLASYSSYAVSARILKGRSPEGSYWDSTDPYYYLRIEGSRSFDRAILGGADHKTAQPPGPKASYESIERMLLKLFPEARKERSWSGQVVETPDGLPLIGEVSERQFAATGFGGNGMTFGVLSGLMFRDAITGIENPWKGLFHPGRKKPLSGAWNYLRENRDYPYYLIRDWIRGAEGSSLRQLDRGEGKILQIKGQRVAAYRDEKGSVKMLSPECTHMGCQVRWNSPDVCWECPCHGSRFRVDGSVLAGPAEEPLKEINLVERTKRDKTRA